MQVVEQCDREPSPEQRAIEHEHFERIHRALASLSPQQRPCLCLRAEGLRYREIAEAVGISIPSVQEFLRRAIERLKELHL